MKRAQGSRLDQDDGGKLLDVPAVKLARRRGGKVSDYTGADIFRTWPDGYRRAVEMIGEGATVSTVAEVLGLSRNTVAGIRDREANSATLEQARQRSAAEFRGVSAIARDKAREVLTDPKAKFRPRDLGALATAATMFEQQAEQLTGGAVVRVEHVHSVKPDDFDELIRAAKRADVLPIHCSGEDVGACPSVEAGAGAGELARVGADRDQVDAGGFVAVRSSSDLLSDDAASICQQSETFGDLSPLGAPHRQGLGGGLDVAGGELASGAGSAASVQAEQPDRGGGGRGDQEAGHPDMNLPTEFRHMPSGKKEKR